MRLFEDRRTKQDTAPWRPVLDAATPEDLAANGRPALAPLRHGFLVNHMVCLLEAGPEGFVILDPATGRVSLTPREFGAKFLGRAIRLQPTPGD